MPDILFWSQKLHLFGQPSCGTNIDKLLCVFIYELSFDIVVNFRLIAGRAEMSGRQVSENAMSNRSAAENLQFL